MAHLDTSDHDDRDGSGTGRRARAARPAWDAATYGTPEDLRRSRPPARGARGGYPSPATDYPPPVPEYRAPEYPAPDYPATEYPDYRDPFPVETPPAYPASDSSGSTDPYRAPDPYQSDPYPTPDPYQVDPYHVDPYQADSFAAAESYAVSEYQDSAYPGTYETEDYPGGVDREHEPPASGSGRAGRNLPAAIGVGVLLGGLAVGSLFIWRPAFLAVVAIAIGVGSWELVRAIRTNGVNPPLIPLIVGGVLMTGLGWWGQADALTFGLVVTVLAAMVWRLADGTLGYSRDVTAATLVAVYVPFLAGFAALLASPSDGGLRVLVTLACVVLSDTGGYIAGVLFGKHPMAPSVSPKKSWEGLGGSLVATAIGGALMLFFAFDVSLLAGALFGLAIAAASVVGDLGESMIKRDLGVKDMSNLLPGHGGLMDRLDSIVFAAPTAYALLMVLAPPL